MPIDMFDSLTQFGAAGLMGTLWIWERLLSRKRERQLTEAHEKLVRSGTNIQILIQLVHRNSKIIERFEQTQRELRKLLESMQNEIGKRAA